LFQGEVMGREAHVKDTARFKSGWAFFPFNGGEGPSQAFPQTSACNTCHEQHAAVDTTFVQFYPTLMAKSQEKKTLSAAYLAEEGKPKDEKR
ncbi:MAG TPA: cytochrome P460 family protein, partial [Phenylobacterium sp.]